MSRLKKFAQKVEFVVEHLVEGLTEKVHQVPVYELGLKNVPAIPFKIEGLLKTLKALAKRNAQTQQAVQGLSNLYTLDGRTLPAHAFLWGEKKEDDEENSEHRGDVSGKAREDLTKMLERNPLAVSKHLVTEMNEDEELIEKEETAGITTLPMEEPEQFSMAWTTFPDVYGDSKELLAGFAETLTDPDTASKAFWTTISEYGMPYNLLFTEKVGTDHTPEMEALFGAAWDQEIRDAQAAGLIYMIDLRIFETCAPQQAGGALRVSPASITVLRQDAETKALEPVLIRVSGEGGVNAQIYVRGKATDSAWLYALQAAKASIGVYGIWLGHVYHWHIPTAAVQMTMYNCLPEEHSLYRLLHPQSQYLIEFDTLLLLMWKHIAPPTSITSSRLFLQLENNYAEGRTFFDDDPKATLERLGIREEDFTLKEPWDQYRFVANLLKLWDITGEYVEKSVNALYANDDAVKGDEKLQEWMKETAKPDEGNIRGLPTMDSREALRKFLHSYLYRITAHGSSRLPSSANPGLTFVPNFPPCLQRSDIPQPEAELSTKELLSYLPNTGTIGSYLSFFYIFSFSVPYASVIPVGGIEEELFFDGSSPEGAGCNEALIAFRKQIMDFIVEYQDGSSPQFTQWARNIET